MPTQWTNTIRQTGQLTVKFNAQIRNSTWGNVAQRSITQFNRLSQRHRLGVKLKATTTATANVLVSFVNGTASFSSGNTRHNVSLAGNRLHGRTVKLSRSSRIFQAYVFLPSNPQIQTPSVPRGVGDGVKLVIAVHEFIHCCGLSDSDHTSDDLFAAYPSTSLGNTSQRDRVVVQPSGGRQRTMPPLFLGATTISRLRVLWGTQRRRGASGRKRASITEDGVQTGVAVFTGDVHGGQREQGPIGIT
jgi:hypothetical protein